MAGYGTNDAFATWLASNGYVLPDGAPTADVLRQRGSSYIDGLYGPRFVGQPTLGLAQDRVWPRSGAFVYGAAIPDDLVPVGIVDASYAAALYEAENPGGLATSVTASGAVKREKVGPIETEYFGGQGSAVENATPVLSAVEGLLAPFLLAEMPDVAVGLWSVGR